MTAARAPRATHPLVPIVPTAVDRLAALEARLFDGDARIARATASGQDVAAWEGFWVDLLRQYEDLAEAMSTGSVAEEDAADKAA